MWQTTSGVNDLLLFQNEHLSNPQLQRTTRKYNRDTNFLVINGEKGQSLQMFSLDNLSDKSDDKKIDYLFVFQYKVIRGQKYDMEKRRIKFMFQDIFL